MYVTITEFCNRIQPLIDQYDEYQIPYAHLPIRKRAITSEKNYEAKRRDGSQEILTAAKACQLTVESPLQVKSDITFLKKYISNHNSYEAAPYEILLDNLVNTLNCNTYLFNEDYASVIDSVPTLKSAKEAIINKQREKEIRIAELAAETAILKRESEHRIRGYTEDEELTQRIRKVNFEDGTVEEMLRQMNEFFNEIDALEELYGITKKSKYSIVIRKMVIPSDPDELLELCDGLDQYFLNDERFEYQVHDDKTNRDKTVSYFDGKIKDLKRALKEQKVWKECNVEKITHRKENKFMVNLLLSIIAFIVGLNLIIFLVLD